MAGYIGKDPATIPPSLATLSDVDLTGVSLDDALFYNGASWGPSAVETGASAAEVARIEWLEDNIALNTLRDAIDAGWVFHGMVDGFADAFADSSGISSASANESYDSDADFYVNAFDDFVVGESGPSSVVSNGGKTATVHDTGAGSPSAFAVEDAAIKTSGKYYGEFVWDSYSGGFCIGSIFLGDPAVDYNSHLLGVDNAYPNAEFRIYASRDFAANRTPSTSVTVYTGTSGLVPGDVLGFAVDLDNGYVWWSINGTWVEGDPAAGTNPTFDNGGAFTSLIPGATHNNTSGSSGTNTATFTIQLAEAEMTYSPPAGFDPWAGKYAMTLVSESVTASAAPDTARAVILADYGAATLNTDVIVEISRDNGTTWTAATLVDEGDYNSNGVSILTTGAVDLTSQPSGTEIKIRLRTPNTDSVEVHSWTVQWS